VFLILIFCRRRRAGDTVRGRNEQDPGVRHFRFRPVFQARPDRRGEGALVSDRFGPDDRGMEGIAVGRRGRRTGQ